MSIMINEDPHCCVMAPSHTPYLQLCPVAPPHPPVPICVPPSQEGVHALEVVLEGGQHTWGELSVGHPLDFDALQTATQGSGG